MDRFRLSTSGFLLVGEVLILSTATSIALARPSDGIALVLGATIHAAADSLAMPHPLAPSELVRAAAGSGTYDIYFHFFSRRPLVGAWTVDIAFDFDRRPGHGIDIEAWESLAARSSPHAGFPDAGPDHGIRLEWNRPDCFDEDHPDLLAGRDGWFRQSALRLRVRVYGPDALILADPEPGVHAEVVQCFDDAFRLDGEDGWARYDGPVFTAVESEVVARPIPDWKLAVRNMTWGGLKARVASYGSRP